VTAVSVQRLEQFLGLPIRTAVLAEAVPTDAPLEIVKGSGTSRSIDCLLICADVVRPSTVLGVRRYRTPRPISYAGSGIFFASDSIPSFTIESLMRFAV
jgi:hypothetical protein